MAVTFDPKGITTNQNPTGPGSGFGCIAACTQAGTGIVDPVCVADCVTQGGTGVVPKPKEEKNGTGDCISQCQQRYGITCIGDIGFLSCACIKACKQSQGKTKPGGGIGSLEGLAPIAIIVLAAILIIAALALLTR